jgi:hypothetical protein
MRFIPPQIGATNGVVETLLQAEEGVCCQEGGKGVDIVLLLLLLLLLLPIPIPILLLPICCCCRDWCSSIFDYDRHSHVASG